MALKVFKFGGSLLSDVSSFKQIKKIVELHFTPSEKEGEKNNIIIVVSAFGKTTSKLLKAATTAELNGEISAMPIVNDIIQYHIGIVNSLIKCNIKNAECKAYIQEQHTLLVNYIKGISLIRELSPRVKDLVLSIGELLASYIFSKLVSEYIQKIISFDIMSVLITDDNYGAANPNLELTEINIKSTLIPLLRHCDVLVTQGFIGSTINGEVTTMGYESSNLTATILAGLTNADEFIIWTDVEGIRQYDPKLYSSFKPKLINKISYDFAEYLGCCGLKLIYPKMIELLRKFNIEVTYRSGLVPEGEYTIIGTENNSPECQILIHIDNLAAYNSNGINRFDANSFPAISHFLQEQNNVTLISPFEHLFISKDNLSAHLEKDLLETHSYKKYKICSLLLINFDYSDFADAVLSLDEDLRDQIINVFVNCQKKTIYLIYKENEEIDKKDLGHL